jgi:hypothetical protein
MGVLKGEVPAAFGVTLPTNDLIWWVPFALILLHARAHHRVLSSAAPRP